MNGNRRLLRSVGWAILLTATRLAASPAATPSQQDWDRSFVGGGPSADAPAVRIELTYLYSQQGHLVGEFHVGNTSSAVVEINGTESSDGKFWADVVIQVAQGENSAEWKWRNVGRSTAMGKARTLSVAPQTFSSPLYINLDEFKPLIGTATYGRVVFTNGKWSMFELNDLLPKKTN
jgi:hypothetical protein